MGQPIFRVGGIASGLDTESIISSLVQIERIPINRMATQRAVEEAKDAAWTDINTQVSQMRSSVDVLRLERGLESISATSSDESVATVAVTGSATPGTLTFTVDQLAATHQVTTASGFSEATSTVGAGTVSVTIGAETFDVATSATTTLTELASSIRSLDGVDASVLKVADGDYRLNITAVEGGAAGVFTLTSTGTSLDTEQILSQGADAQLTVGSGPGAVQVTRASNTITDLIAGAELQLFSTSTDPITVSTERDVEAIADNVAAVVDAVNGVFGEIERLTAFDTNTNTGSILTGDSNVRTLDTRLNDLMGQTINELGSSLSAGSPLSYTRTGDIELDRDQLIGILRDDYSELSEALGGIFGADDSRITAVSTTSSTTPGVYDVTVTSGGTSPTSTGAAYSPSASFEDFNLQYNGTNVLVGVGAGSTISSAISQINDALTLAGISDVVASDNGGAIEISTPGLTGTGVSFVIWADGVWGLNGTFTGTESAGFIGGEVATADGNRYTATTGDPEGLVVDVDLSSVDTSGGPVSVGNVSYIEGLLVSFDGFLDDVEGIDGFISRARDEYEANITSLDDQIANMELRVERRETTLRRQYTAMEQALASMQSNASFLNGLISQPQSGQ